MLTFLKIAMIRVLGGVLSSIGIVFALAFITYGKNNIFINTKTTDRISQLFYKQADFLVQFVGVSAVFAAFVFVVWGIKIICGQKIYNPRIRCTLLILNIFLIGIGIRYLNIPLYPITEDIFIYAHGLIGQVLYTYTLSFTGQNAIYWATVLLAISFLIGIYTLAITVREWTYLLNLLKRSISSIKWIFKGFAWGANKIIHRKNTNDTEKTLQAVKDHFPPQDTSPVDHSTVTKSQSPMDIPTDIVAPNTPPKPRKPLHNTDTFQLPPLDLLENLQTNRTKVSESELEAMRKQLAQTLQDFKVDGNIVGTRIGPVVTTYELELAPGVRENRVIGLANDIARNMGAESIRISRIPGKTVIGIELPNVIRETVSFKEIVSSPKFQNTDMALPLVLGRDVEGAVAIADLSSMPHLLIAGTTGSGKSVGINAMILSLLYRYSPENLKMIMVDPKIIEFSMYKDIPHLLAPVVTEPSKAVVALKWAVHEMNRRYEQMSKLGVGKISEYNSKVATLKKSGEIPMETITNGFDDNGEPIYEQRPIPLEHYPYIVVIVDEMADLMLSAGKDINDSIQSLSQKSRAADIHLIVATQRPSTNVITGTIKANCPARISYRVTSKIDSRVILDSVGAEQLLGRGDMLFFNTKITRNHAPFVQGTEVKRVCDWLRQQETPEYINAITDVNSLDTSDDTGGTRDGNSDSDKDAKYDEAVELVTRTRKASTSFIQRSLGIGYNRAANLIEQLEQDGVVSPATQTGKRTVLAPEREYN